MRPFENLQQVKDNNKAKEYHFFDADSMRFFNSVIETGLLKGTYFVTSERMELDIPKEYTIRKAHIGGNIETVGKFQAYKTLAEARTEISELH